MDTNLPVVKITKTLGMCIPNGSAKHAEAECLPKPPMNEQIQGSLTTQWHILCTIDCVANAHNVL